MGFGAGTSYLNSYGLQIWGGEQTPDDPFEENDTLDQLRSLTVSAPTDYFILADVAWFGISIWPAYRDYPGFRPGGAIDVDASFGVDVGAELYDSQGRFVADVGSYDEFGDLHGDFYLKFTPRGMAARYSFRVNDNFWDDGW